MLIINLFEYVMSSELANYVLWGNKLIDYLFAFGLFVIFIILLKIVKLLTLKFFFKSLKENIKEYIRKSIFPLLIFESFYLCLFFVKLPDSVRNVINYLNMLLITTYILFFINFIIKNYSNNLSGINNFLLDKLVKIANFLVWLFGIFLILDNLGVKVSSIIAGLGIGSVIIAISLQTLFADLFHYGAIIMDKPFVIGDLIEINNIMGTIEHIGLRITRIRSINGEALYFSNAELIKTYLKNYTNMKERRVVSKLDISYDTDLNKIQNLVSFIRETISLNSRLRFDRAHFKCFADSSIVIEYVYYVLSKEYIDFMNEQEKLNYKILDWTRNNGVEIVYPTQNIFIKNMKNSNQ